MIAKLDDVLGMRLDTQRLTSAPLASVEATVGLLVCVQAQDAALARWSLGRRSGDVDEDAVRASLDSGRILRTHILRPTWHFVLAEDLGWLLELTSAKVESSMASRHRQLGLDEDVVRRGHAEIADLLCGGTFLTRQELGARMRRLDLPGERLGHLLLLAELRGLICSGPLHGVHHTYALASERVPAAPRRDRDSAVRELVHRFFAGHGPASIAHLARWTTVTRTEISAAIGDLGDQLAWMTVGNERQWYDPMVQPRAEHQAHAFMLPTFDEAFLTYPGSNFPRLAGHPLGDRPHSFAEAGGGLVVCDLRDVGWWTRRQTASRIDVVLALSATLTAAQKRRVESEAERLAAFTGRRLVLRPNPHDRGPRVTVRPTPIA